jgi:hypothetical protein
MSAQTSRQREIREIAIAANSDEALDAQFARLNELIVEDPQLASYTAMLFDLQASLAWRGSMFDQPAANSVGAAAGTEVMTSQRPVGHSQRFADRRAISMAHLGWTAVAVGIAFALGGLAYPLLWPSSQRNLTSVHEADVSMPRRAKYEARLIRSTACLWDSNSVGSTEIGSGVTSGESLHLLEGLAEFTLEWSRGGNATLSLEGPAAMMLNSEGMPTLRFGRVTATINSTFRPFVLETPVGRLVVSEFGSVGASAFGNDGEIHVFDGAATLQPAWRTSSDHEIVPLKIEAGEAIRIQEGHGGELTITRHPSDKEYFVAQLSMNSDALIIPPTYAQAVKDADPIGYWRFERDTWPVCANQMGSQFECRVVGALGVAAYHGNQVVEFGVTDQGGEIICNDLLNDAITKNYSIEFWIKPSHYQVGSVVSLVGDADTPNGIIPHGLLLELGGTGLIPTAVHHPGRMRFLHRSPASNESELGTSCYSTDAYTLRKWQHVAAVKDASHMCIYINGRLAGDGEDATQLPTGMRLLVGRLYPSRQVRPFVGQLDELAIYNRALTLEEIAKHYRLVRPKSKVADDSI